MKKILGVLAVFLLVVGLAGSAGADLINPSFETGFSGWTLTGDGGWVVPSYTSDGGTVYLPKDGNYFASLMATSTLSQTVSLAAGETLTGWAAFDARDYLPYDDYAWVKIKDGGSNILWSYNVTAVGNYGESPWELWSWTAPVADAYTLEYGVANYGDFALPSYAIFDAGSKVAPIPEPATMLLLGSGLVGIAGLGRRRILKKQA